METDRKDSGDPNMLSLFREELAEQLQILESGLAEIEQELPTERMDCLLHAVHAIKGAFRVVGLPVAMRLASAMEEVLSELGQTKRCLLPVHIDQLRQAAAFFREIRKQEEKDILPWVSGQEASMRRVAQALWKFLAETQGVPFAESLATAPPQDEAPGEAKTSIAMLKEVEEVPNRSDKLDIHGGEIPSGDCQSQTPRHIQLNQDNLLALAGECLLQARKIRELHPLLRSLECGAPVLETQIVMSSLSEETNPVKNDGKASTTDPLPLLDRSSQQLEHLAGHLFNDILASRTIPFASLIRDYDQRISDLAGQLGKVVTFNRGGDMTAVDRDILRKLEEPLWQLIRQVLVYSLETPMERESVGKSPDGNLSLAISSETESLHLILTDDGRGMARESLDGSAGECEGWEQKKIAGEGHVLSFMMRSLDGSIDWEYLPGEGTKVHLVLPAIPGIRNCLLVRIAGELYALSMAEIDRVARVSPENRLSIEGRPWAAIDGENVVLIDAGQILNLPGSPSSAGDLPVIVLKRGQSRCGLVVEAFLGEEKLVLRPLDERLGKVAYIRAMALLGDGSPALVLDMNDLFEAV
jgi:two-component system, chemotaxis family, sensor histidine kinase and response regulator WspE